MSAEGEWGLGSGPVAGVELGGPGLASLVERERLSSRLRAAETPLILLHAPAGYGKSVLLAQWARLDPRPFASTILNETHNDPAVLLAALIEAFEPIEPLPDPVVATMQGPQLDLDVAVPRLEAALRARSVESVLVLDELEHLHSEDSLRLLAATMNGTVGGSRLAMATRRAPPIHLPRLQAAQRLAVFETGDLVMTKGEANRLLTEAGLRASQAEVDAIVTRTEGWPVALYLATVGRRSLRGLPLPDSGFGGEEHNLVEYMRDEFLAIAAPEDVEFLIRVSVLDRLGGEVCDAVSGGVGSASRLARLARQNMLLIPLDRRDEWFRLHTLFADMLRAELRRRLGGEMDELNRRASAWWESADDPERAIRFAIDGSDFTRAGRLIWEAVPAFNTTGRYASVQGWIEKVGLRRAAADPHLSLTVAHGALAAGDGGAAEYWGEIARPMVASGPQTGTDLPAALAMLDATLARDGASGMTAAAGRALASLDRDSPWAAMADLMAGLAAHFGGDGTDARRRLSDAARRSAVWNIPLIQVLALAQLALLAAAEGDWQTARILASQGRAQVDRSGLTAQPSIALTIAVSAYVAANDRRREQALADLELARSLSTRLQDFGPWFEIETAAALAAAAIQLSEVEATRELVSSARARLGAMRDAPMLEAWVQEIETDLSSLSEGGLAELTPAEMRVLSLLPSHLSYPQIAARLLVSPNTIKSQVRSVFRKLGVSSRHEAVEIYLIHAMSAERGPAAVESPVPTREPPRIIDPPIAPSG